VPSGLPRKLRKLLFVLVGQSHLRVYFFSRACIDAPARLRRELDKVLSLQTQIDAVYKGIQDAKQSITGPAASSQSMSLLRGLQQTHETLSQEAEALYASLNIHNSFPQLKASHWNSRKHFS
jgi:hypothetical protein